jgi:DNA-binding NtrC family response regulator
MESIQLLVYDEKNPFSSTLLDDLIQRGFALRVLEMDELLASLAQQVPDAVLMNLAGTPGADRLAMVQEIHSLDEHLPIFVLVPHSDVQTAVSFMKGGARDYVVLPPDVNQLEASIRRASHMYHLTKKVYQLERKGGHKGDFLGIVGQSAKMQENFKLISTVSKSNATVLIQGESGTGKELVAKALHVLSGRPKTRFVDLNCGAIPRELLENELFGHERGSYTGADRRYIGSFERANGGTIFLDEISEMDPALQVKILRVLQERSFQRVGGNEKVLVDVRVVAATNRDLQKEVESGRFREDLYYRLNVVPVILPPLRERREDVPILARHFLNIYSLKNDKIFLDFHPEAMEVLINYNWPGNVRELENTIERIVVLSNDSQVKSKHLPPHLQSVDRMVSWSRDQSLASIMPENEVLTLEQIEKNAIERALKKCEGNILEAARRLKVGQATLYRKIRKFGIAKEEV